MGVPLDRREKGAIPYKNRPPGLLVRGVFIPANSIFWDVVSDCLIPAYMSS